MEFGSRSLTFVPFPPEVLLIKIERFLLFENLIERSIISGKVEGKLAAGKIICACNQIGQKTIENAIIEHKLSSQQAVSSCTGAGTGCGKAVGVGINLLKIFGA